MLKIVLQMWARGEQIKEETSFIGLEHNPSSPQAALLPKDLIIVFTSISLQGARKIELYKGNVT